MLFAAPLLLLIAAPDTTYSLQWKLKEGDTFFNKTTITLDQAIEVMGQKVNQKMEMTMVIRFKVKEAREGKTVVEMTYLDTKIDSAGLPGANIGEKFKNVSFTATLNDKLQVTKVEGYDKFLDALTDGDEAQKKIMKAMMPEASIRQMFGQTFVVAPDRPIALGETWKRTDKLSMGALGNVETKATFTLDAVKEEIAKIGVQADLSYKANDNEDSPLPFKITNADLKADRFTGTNSFNIKVGRIVESRMEIDMSGTMTIEVMGQQIDAKLKQKMKMVGVVTDKNPIVD
jgi:hypothetical protein